MKTAAASAMADLLALAPAEFTAARNARVKELRAAGDTDAAAHVAKLRRPSVTTWAVNAAARTNPSGTRTLVEAVCTLQKPGSVDVRAATKQLDAALDALVDSASVELARIDTKPTADRKADVRSALRVAALAEDPSALLEARVLDGDAADADDTLAAALRAGAHGAGRARRSTSSSKTTTSTRAPALKQLRAALAEARAEQTVANDALRTAEQELRAIRRTLASAEVDVQRAKDAAQAAATAVDARKRELDDARGA